MPRTSVMNGARPVGLESGWIWDTLSLGAVAPPLPAPVLEQSRCITVTGADLRDTACSARPCSASSCLTRPEGLGFPSTTPAAAKQQLARHATATGLGNMPLGSSLDRLMTGVQGRLPNATVHCLAAAGTAGAGPSPGHISTTSPPLSLLSSTSMTSSSQNSLGEGCSW